MFGDKESTEHTRLGALSLEQTSEVLRGYMDYFNDRGYGMLAVINRENGAYLGEVGIWDAPVSPTFPVLRYGIVRSSWGRGYASEAAEGLLQLYFDVWGLGLLRAGVAPENVASSRVLEKVGFVFHDLVQPDGPDGRSFREYRMTPEMWEARASTVQRP